MNDKYRLEDRQTQKPDHAHGDLNFRGVPAHGAENGSAGFATVSTFVFTNSTTMVIRSTRVGSASAEKRFAKTALTISWMLSSVRPTRAARDLQHLKTLEAIVARLSADPGDRGLARFRNPLLRL